MIAERKHRFRPMLDTLVTSLSADVTEEEPTLDSTEAYVKKLHETQAKDDKNRRTHGKGDPDRKLPGKQKER
ncbi:MAG: hypothetical protein K0Q59_1627 [Paenibacillus sp.]|jgi:hypothetical protein|nr:hypothetical protein [Paenibacillus sp.]